VLYLARAWRYALLICKLPFGGTGLSRYTAVTVIANSGVFYICLIDDHGFPVDVMDICGVHACNCGVIEKASAVPITALVPRSFISEPIMDAAIIADMRTPVTGMPHIYASAISPIAGCPKQSGPWR
jgi:hypothetical protein